jgi:hypothetical protein
MEPLPKKWALITGASSGIGKAFAQRLAQDNYNIILVSRHGEALTALANDLMQRYTITAKVIAKDLADIAAPQALFDETQQLGIHIDMLINNAGMGIYGKLHTTALAKNQQQILLNVFALSSLTQLYLQAMQPHGTGTIINIASIASFQPVAYMSNYGATKAFVRSFTEALWAEYHNDGIKIIAVCPGPVETNFFIAMGVGVHQLSIGKTDMPETIVNETFTALKHGKLCIIPGRKRNYWQSQLNRFFPQKWIAIVSELLMRHRK